MIVKISEIKLEGFISEISLNAKAELQIQFTSEEATNDRNDKNFHQLKLYFSFSHTLEKGWVSFQGNQSGKKFFSMIRIFIFK